MPTYEYKCEECNHRFEACQSITAQPLKGCPKCRGAVKRLISGGGAIIFKGTGFYKTDYRSESYKKKVEAERPKEKKEADRPKEAHPHKKECEKKL